MSLSILGTLCWLNEMKGLCNRYNPLKASITSIEFFCKTYAKKITSEKENKFS